MWGMARRRKLSRCWKVLCVASNFAVIHWHWWMLLMPLVGANFTVCGGSSFFIRGLGSALSSERGDGASFLLLLSLPPPEQEW